MFVIFV